MPQASQLPAAQSLTAPPVRGSSLPLRSAPFDRHAARPIHYVIVIVQENRTVDNLFQFLRGANTQSYGYDGAGQRVDLKAENLNAHYNPSHRHEDWEAAYNDGAMNGWNQEDCEGSCPDNFAFGYVPKSEVQPYYDMAERYAFGDEMFQTNQGPSFPAHQYLVSGTSTIVTGGSLRAAENPSSNLHVGGCDSPMSTRVALIDINGDENYRRFPCFDRTSIFTLLDRAGVSWRYYQAFQGAGTWNAVDALKPIWAKKTEMARNVVSPSQRVLTDIASGNLVAVSFVTPTAKESDHSGINDGSGPDWVADIVNTVGRSPYWNSTAIIVTWDDWGGWFDHVTPHVRNSYELSFRVPLLVVSPYAKAGHVSHTHYEFGSILKFIETTYGLPSLDTTDLTASDLNDMFDFSIKHSFRPIETKRRADYFLHQAADLEQVDDD